MISDPYKLLQKNLRFDRPIFYVEDNGTYLEKVVFSTTDKEVTNVLKEYAGTRGISDDQINVYSHKNRTLDGKDNNIVTKDFIEISLDKRFDSLDETREAIMEFGRGLLNYVINRREHLIKKEREREREIEEYLKGSSAIEIYLE